MARIKKKVIKDQLIGEPYQGFATAMAKFSVQAAKEILRSVLHLVLVILLGFVLGNKLFVYAVMMAGLTLRASALFIISCKKNHARFVS